MTPIKHVGEKTGSSEARRGGQASHGASAGRFYRQFGVRTDACGCYPDSSAGHPDAIQSVLISTGRKKRPVCEDRAFFMQA